MLHLIYGAAMLALGLPMLFWPRQKRLEAEQKLATRLAELNAGADEEFFEEKRALTAYPPLKTDLKWRLLGVLLVVGGARFIFESVNR